MSSNGDRGSSGRDFRNAYAIVLAKLGRRDHTEKELRTALRRKLLPEGAIDRAIEKAREQALVDDVRFAERRARSAASVGVRGPRKVMAALRQKGISGEAAEAAVREAFAPSSDLDERLVSLASRTLRRARGETLRIRKTKALRSLVARGFALRSARRALDVALNAAISENPLDDRSADD